MTSNSILAILGVLGAGGLAFWFRNLKTENKALNNQVQGLQSKAEIVTQENDYEEAKKTADALVSIYQSLRAKRGASDSSASSSDGASKPKSDS